MVVGFKIFWTASFVPRSSLKGEPGMTFIMTKVRVVMTKIVAAIAKKRFMIYCAKAEHPFNRMMFEQQVLS